MVFVHRKSYQDKRRRHDNLQLLVEKFTKHNLSDLHKEEILELKENHAHVICGST